jgi:hypothetical protein
MASTLRIAGLLRPILSGFGTIDANVFFNGGTLAPMGVIDITGNYTQKDGTVAVRVSFNGVDVVLVTGDVTLGNAPKNGPLLDVTTVAGFVPPANSVFTFMVFDGMQFGVFSAVAGGFSASYDAGDISVMPL